MKTWNQKKIEKSELALTFLAVVHDIKVFTEIIKQNCIAPAGFIFHRK